MTAKIYTQTDRMRPRNLSLELLRIIAMLVIISCHFGVHGVFLVLDPAKSSLPSAVI